MLDMSVSKLMTDGDWSVKYYVVLLSLHEHAQDDTINLRFDPSATKACLLSSRYSNLLLVPPQPAPYRLKTWSALQTVKVSGTVFEAEV